MKVLLAEDDTASRTLLARWLSRWGCRVAEAADGNAAWAQLQHARPPRVAIIDWLMPGCDGLEVLRRLRSETTPGRRPYVIMLTRLDRSEEIVTALDAGADDYMTKPARPAELRARLGVARRLLLDDARMRRSSHTLARYSNQMHQLAEARARQLVHAERLATLGTLAAGVAHEISNPAAVVAGNIQTLRRVWAMLDPHLGAAELPEAEQNALRMAREHFPTICRDMTDSVDRIATIVRQLTGFSRSDAGPVQPCDLAQCARRAVALTSETALKGVPVVIDAAGELPSVLAAPREIEQVLVNLLVNAGHAVANVAEPRVTVRTSLAAGMVAVSVQDNGAGVDDATLKRIWNPFFTTRPAGKGTGLGLTISRTIAERYHGSLDLHNCAGGGACFTLKLPATSAGASAA